MNRILKWAKHPMAKNNRHHLPHRYRTIHAAILISIAAGGTAQAITSDAFTYSPAKTGYLSVHPMALTPNNTAASDSYFIGYAPAYLRALNNVCFQTGVNIPNGAIITRVLIWSTASVSNNNFVYLSRVALSSGTAMSLVSAGLMGETGTRRLDSYALPVNASRVVNNGSYAYGFGVCLGTNDEFNGARIDYTYTNAGD